MARFSLLVAVCVVALAVHTHCKPVVSDDESRMEAYIDGLISSRLRSVARSIKDEADTEWRNKFARLEHETRRRLASLEGTTLPADSEPYDPLTAARTRTRRDLHGLNGFE